MDAALTEERNPMNIVLKGIHAVANADRLRRKMRREASIQCHTPEMGADALAGMLSDADVLIAMHVEPDLPPAPRLKMLQLPGAGYDAITWSALPADIPVCNVFEHEIGIAEYVILAMLEWNIRMCRMDSVFRTGKWEHSLLSFGSTHGELAGKTVAILGYGHIGRAITARVRAFGVDVIAIGRTKPEDRDAECVTIEELDEVLPRTDYLVLACPLTDATRGLIDGRRLTLMKSDSVIINIARAAVCDEDALYDALARRVIGGAVLDVWYRYPAPGQEDNFRPANRPFHELDNVIMTPHASAWTEGLMERRWSVIAENMDRFAAGEPLLNRITRPA